MSFIAKTTRNTLNKTSAKEAHMKTFLLIGLDPSAIDFSATTDPAVATGEKLMATVAASQKQFADRGDRLDNCKILADGSAAPVIEQLARASYDCVLIGGGILAPANLETFERIINSVHRYAPSAIIGYVKLPKDALTTANRVMSKDFERAALLSPSAA